VHFGQFHGIGGVFSEDGGFVVGESNGGEMVLETIVDNFFGRKWGAVGGDESGEAINEG
jgi:hypothetical protein